MKIATALAYRALGLRMAPSLSDVAQEALMDGLDSPALREVAGATVHDDDERVARRFATACEELGIAPPSARDARELVARDIGATVLSGKLTPYEGARRVWGWLCRDASDRQPHLLVFVGLASEYEDQPELAQQLEKDMMEEFRLLATRPLPEAK